MPTISELMDNTTAHSLPEDPKTLIKQQLIEKYQSDIDELKLGAKKTNRFQVLHINEKNYWLIYVFPDGGLVFSNEIYLENPDIYPEDKHWIE